MKKRKPKKIYLAVIPICFVLFSAFSIKAEEKDNKGEEKKYFSSTSFSFLLIRGNSEDLTFSFDTDQSLNFKKDKLNLKIDVILTRTNRQEKSEIYYSQLKYNRQMNSRAYLLGLMAFDRNKSAGIDFRLAFSVGAGYMIIQQKKMKISSELSLGWTREQFRKLISPENIQEGIEKGDISHEEKRPSYVSSIFSTRLMYDLSSSSQFIHQESLFFNLRDLEDWRIYSSTSLSASISRYFALKLSLRLIYDHQPVPGFKSTDIFLLNSLVIKF